MIRMLNILFLLSLLPWTMLVFVILLFNDSPATASTGLRLFRVLLFTYPIAIVGSRIAAAAATRRNRPELAFRLTLIPFAWFFLAVAVLSS